MKDIFELYEDAAERRYFDKIQPDGQFKCDCGNLFDPAIEGGVASNNPWAMPVCGNCFDDAIKNINNKKSRAY